MTEEPDESSEGKGGIPPITRKILSLGLGAFFLGEDYIRRAVKEAKLPRDIGKSIAQNAAKGKEELYAYVARELSGFLRQMDIQAELSRFATTHKIKVTTEIEISPRNPPEPKAASSESSDARAPLPESPEPEEPPPAF